MLKSCCVLSPFGRDHIEVPIEGGVEISATDSMSETESDRTADELVGETGGALVSSSATSRQTHGMFKR